MVRLLLWGGADPDLAERSPRAATPLLLAAAAGHARVVRLLLRGNASGNASGNATWNVSAAAAQPAKADANGVTPLAAAAAGGHESTAAMLRNAEAVA